MDSILRGGLPRAALTYVSGPTGSGKSMLALQICRALRDGAVYFLGPGRLAAAYAARFAEPQPRYVELGPTILNDGLGASLPLIREELARPGVDLAVFDSCSGMGVGGGGPEAACWRHGLIALLWEAGVTGLALGSRSAAVEEFERVAQIATLAIELNRGDSVRPRYLKILKYEGGAYTGADHPFRITPLGLAFEAAALPRGDVSPVSSLGARLLNAFRTARRSTASELAALLGQELMAVEATLGSLVESGYLAVIESDEGEVVYAVPTTT